MPSPSRRHRLLLYTFLLNRWWRAVMACGLTLLLLTAGLALIPYYFPHFPVVWVADWILWITAGLGALTVGGALFLASIRKSAYVQVFPDHLRLVTPFLRLRIGYQRLRRTYSAEMGRLFPVNRVRGRKREILRLLASRTAVVLELRQLPLSRPALSLFLSPFFFPDKTPRMALLVSDWMAFATELDSALSVFQDRLRQSVRPPASGLLGNLNDSSRPR
ncbi:MAG: hypothetical protein ABWK53_12570 [Anaerolineales bacterium]